MKKNTSQNTLTSWIFAHSFWFGVAGVLILYTLTHLIWLGHFPVFADEAIYIRWAQLLLDDPGQYVFFALNDGKTPLYIWMMSGFQAVSSVFGNQLVAGRVLSVIGGFLQVMVVGLLLRQLGTRQPTQLLGMLLTTLLPFWFTYHRLALMDGWLSLWLSLAVLFAFRLMAEQRILRQETSLWSWKLLVLVLGYGLSLGLALWTKLPALFFFSISVWLPLASWFLLPQQKKSTNHHHPVIDLILFGFPHAVAVALGILCFAGLIISPAFGQLFSRGQDFTFTIAEILSGKWTETFANVARFASYFLVYMTWPVMLVATAGLFSHQGRKRVIVLLVSGALFLLPFAILGKVVHPRYLLPAAIFFTLAASISAEAMLLRILAMPVNFKKGLFSIVAALLLGQTVSSSLLFMSTFALNPNSTPFVQHDRVQYLEEWSSGHGLAESVEFIRTQMADHTVAVATEGRFGSLPDGLLLYFYGQNVDNLYIEGTGQYPVKSLPPFFTHRAKTAEQSLLIVNSHRMELPLPPTAKLAEFCRPHNAPCLQIWDITEQVKVAVESEQEF